MTIIQTNHLTKVYKTIPALYEASVTINEGDIYGLVGKNGAGKTTLMRIICGLTEKTSGSYSLFGEVSEQGLQTARKQIGGIIEQPSLYPTYTARRNLECIAHLRNVPLSRVDDMLAFAGLSDVEGRKVQDFSLGMRQRLAISMAMMHEPRLLVLDEPVNGLDPVGIMEMRAILQRINRERGVTIIISSHLLGELSQLATKFGFIDRGILLEEITAAELHSKVQKTVDIVFSDATQVQRGMNVLLPAMNGSVMEEHGDTVTIKGGDAAERTPEFNMLLAQAGIMVRGVSIHAMELEQYFMNLTQQNNPQWGYAGNMGAGGGYRL